MNDCWHKIQTFRCFQIEVADCEYWLFFFFFLLVVAVAVVIEVVVVGLTVAVVTVEVFL